MSVVIENEGWEVTLEQLQRLQAILRNELSSKLIEAGTEIVNNTKMIISEAYPPPSSPFNPPHLRTGQLQESYDILEYDEFSVTVGSELDYSFYLEYGTVKMAPRPHLIPTAIEVIKDFPRLLIQFMDKEVSSLG